MSRKTFIMPLLALLAAGLFTTTAYADHAWSTTYHWERSSNPLSVELGDNVDSRWDGHLLLASTDWSVSSVLDTTVVAGSTSARRCKATAGNVQVCNLKYGNNGWLGIAGISISGDHITSGYVKLNDTYFDTPNYDTPEWRQLVTCQEVGHTFGLNHQDETFSNANLGTCMDYTDSPADNQHPNQHDYDQLESMYTHLDAPTGGTGGDTRCNPRSPKCNPAVVPYSWGRLVSRHGPMEVFELDLGNGNKIITYVTWTLEHAQNHGH
jgi:hypothetical protein